MSGIVEAAAALAAALKSGNSQDAESALAQYAEATADADDAPEVGLGPLKRSLDELPDAVEVEAAADAAAEAAAAQAEADAQAQADAEAAAAAAAAISPEAKKKGGA